MNQSLENPIMTARLEMIEKDISVWASKAVNIEFPISGTPIFSMIELALSFPKRCDDLCKATHLLLENNRTIPATVTARSLIETIGIGCLYIDDLERLIDLGDNTKLEARFLRFYAGSGQADIKPIHVMDAIRHLNVIDIEYFDALFEKKEIIDLLVKFGIIDDGSFDKSKRDNLSIVRSYDLLSEVTHPNGFGTQYFYHDETYPKEEVEKYRQLYGSRCLISCWQMHHLLRKLEKLDNIILKLGTLFGRI